MQFPTPKLNLKNYPKKNLYFLKKNFFYCPGKKILYFRTDADQAKNFLYLMLFPTPSPKTNKKKHPKRISDLFLGKKFLFSRTDVDHAPNLLYLLILLGWLLIKHKIKKNSDTLAWLLIKCQIKKFLIMWDDCWFSLPSELKIQNLTYFPKTNKINLLPKEKGFSYLLVH